MNLLYGKPEAFADDFWRPSVPEWLSNPLSVSPRDYIDAVHAVGLNPEIGGAASASGQEASAGDSSSNTDEVDVPRRLVASHAVTPQHQVVEDGFID